MRIHAFPHGIFLFFLDMCHILVELSVLLIVITRLGGPLFLLFWKIPLSRGIFIITVIILVLVILAFSNKALLVFMILVARSIQLSLPSDTF